MAMVVEKVCRDGWCIVSRVLGKLPLLFTVFKCTLRAHSKLQ